MFSVYFISYVTVTGFDSILVEKFPEYVQDMMKNKGKIKAEFIVGLCVSVCVCVLCVWRGVCVIGRVFVTINL